MFTHRFKRVLGITPNQSRGANVVAAGTSGGERSASGDGRALTLRPVQPDDCAQPAMFLAGPRRAARPASRAGRTVA